MRILTLGDVFGEEAAKYLSEKLFNYINTNNIDFTIANCENGSGASGVEPQVADRLLASGCDVLTGGNHSLGKASFLPYLSNSENVLRPANYPNTVPGSGYTVKKAQNGLRLLVISLRGNAGFDMTLDCPFRTMEKILEYENGNYDICIVDIHAEFTSEKLAFFHAFNGRASVIAGTHTHVPTADLQISAMGTGYITDLGMCGPTNSILGVTPEAVITRMRDKLPARFETAKGKLKAMGAVFDIDDNSGKCISAKRIEF